MVSMVLQVLGFYKFQGSTGSRVVLILKVPGFYRFYGFRVLQVLWFPGSIVVQVPAFLWFYRVPWFYRFQRV